MEPCCAVCFLGRTPKCKTPSVDVQSVPRFTHRDHTAVRSIKKENHQRLLLWEVSVMQQRHWGHEAPVQALKKWKMKAPDLFVKNVRNHPGPDNS